MAELAKNVEVTRDDVIIDGQPFPWDIKNSLTATWGGDSGLHELTLTVLVSGEIWMEDLDG